MIALIALVGLVALAASCSGEAGSPPPPGRKRPEHPDGGTPPFDDDEDGGTGEDTVARQAEEAVGSSFDLYVHASKEGRDGCGTVRVEALNFTSTGDGRTAAVTGTARWFSPPPTFPKEGQVPSGIAYRSGDFPISWVTEEYPEYGSLGLKYLVTGSYDVGTARLALTLANINAKSGDPSDLFLAAVYDPWQDEEGAEQTCRADGEIGNEFFIAIPAAEAEIPITASGGEGTVCEPCKPPVDSVSLEIP